MAKIVKKILSPETVAQIDKAKEFHVSQTEQLKEDRRERDSYIAPDGDVDIFAHQSAAQQGRVLHTNEIMRRLRRINPALIYEISRAFPDIGAIYIVENVPDPITNKSPWKRHICGIPHGMVWEFHRPLVVFEEIPEADGLGTVQSVKLEGKVPGWREVLARLIVDGVIKPADAEREFHITQGRSSAKWKAAGVN
jgi:hypothetical protein